MFRFISRIEKEREIQSSLYSRRRKEANVKKCAFFATRSCNITRQRRPLSRENRTARIFRDGWRISRDALHKRLIVGKHRQRQFHVIPYDRTSARAANWRNTQSRISPLQQNKFDSLGAGGVRQRAKRWNDSSPRFMQRTRADINPINPIGESRFSLSYRRRKINSTCHLDSPGLKSAINDVRENSRSVEGN